MPALVAFVDVLFDDILNLFPANKEKTSLPLSNIRADVFEPYERSFTQQLTVISPEPIQSAPASTSSVAAEKSIHFVAG